MVSLWTNLEWKMRKWETIACDSCNPPSLLHHTLRLHSVTGSSAPVTFRCRLMLASVHMAAVYLTEQRVSPLELMSF